MSAVVKIDLDTLEQLIQRNVHRAIKGLNKDWVTKAEAAELACCSLRKLDMLIASGEVEASHTGTRGQTVTVSRDSINKWHKKNVLKKSRTVKPEWLK